MGATHVLDRHASEAEIGAKIKSIVGDELTSVYDAVNVGQDAQFGANFLSTTKPSRLVVCAGGDFDSSKVKGKKGGFERVMILAGSKFEPELAKSYWKELPKIIRDGALKATSYQVIDGLDVEKVNGVIKEYSEGKAVIKPQIHPH
jgi:NADPH2:quinone reductase